MRRIALFCLLPLSCHEALDDARAQDDGQDDVEALGLSPEQILTRASLDIRGVRPTEAELDAVAADPDGVDALIEQYLDDPAFGARIRQIFAGAWRTRIDAYLLPEGEDVEVDPAVHAAIGEEPLNLVAYIALNDLPFTELLRSRDTFVDPILLDRWPLQEQGAADSRLPAGTVRARYNDGRPQAGVLGMNAVFWRHSSTVENSNRGRANALSQALLCQSYLDRPIDFPTDLDLTDSESIRHAIKTNEACQACHATLDPFASYLWGFMYAEDIPRASYALDGERGWQINTGVPPGFFGQPGERLEDLADQIAGDERFVSCAVKRVYEGLLGRPANLADEGALAEHREAFLAADLSLRALARSILADPSYRGVSWTPRFGGDPQPVPRKVAPVDVLAASLTDLSGYALTFDGRRATDLDQAVRTLAGGSDRGDATTVSTGAVLVQRRVAEAGAMRLVDRAATGKPPQGRLGELLVGVDLEQPPTPEMVAHLARMSRSRTIALDDPELLALIDLWNDVAGISDGRDAWVSILTATLADPDHLLY